MLCALAVAEESRRISSGVRLLVLVGGGDRVEVEARFGKGAFADEPTPREADEGRVEVEEARSKTSEAEEAALDCGGERISDRFRADVGLAVSGRSAGNSTVPTTGAL